MSGDDDAFVVAIEQYVFWRQRGLSHADMLAALGYFNVRPSDRITAREIVSKLQTVWRTLHLRRAA